MQSENKHYAYFSVTGDFNPEKITALMQISPSKSWAKGDINPQTNQDWKFSRWSLSSRLPQSATLEDHARDLVQQLERHTKGVQQVVNAYDSGALQLMGYFHTNYPGLFLDRKLIADLAELNLAIDCDFYYLYSD
jgi:hypothetical protein